MKKIGILGSGMVAVALADGFLKNSYEVKMGTRSPKKLVDWKAKAGAKGSVGSFKETAAYGELLVLAVKGHVAKDVLEMAGKENLEGKTIIDPTNPIGGGQPVNGVLQFFTKANSSLMEELQKHVPKAHFVKAFNSIGSGHMVDPKFEMKPSMFICGNNEDAKKQVSKILDQFGWEVEDMGAVEAARAIEPLCILWCIPGFIRNEWGHVFKLLR